MSINSNKTPARLALLLTSSAVLGLTLCAPAAGSAQGVYFNKASVLKSFFAKSERVTYRKYALNAEEKRALRKKLGYTPRGRWTVYYGTTRGHVDGLAIIDTEMGQHEPITFATLVATDGHLERLEVMVYREGHGEEIRQPRFRKQFRGRRVTDPIRHGKDIVAISGATISCKAMATGARRALVLVDHLILREGGAQSVIRAASR